MSHRKRLHNTRVRFVSKNQAATSSKRETGEIFSTATDRLCCIFPFQIIHWLSRRGIYKLPTRWAAGCTSRVGLWSSDKHREDEVQTVCSCYSAGDVALLIPMKAAQLHRNSSTRCVHTYINIVESKERPNYRLPPANLLSRDYRWRQINRLNLVRYSFRGRQHEGFKDEEKSRRFITTNRIRAFDVHTIRAANGANAVVVGCFQETPESWDRAAAGRTFIRKTRSSFTKISDISSNMTMQWLRHRLHSASYNSLKHQHDFQAEKTDRELL